MKTEVIRAFDDDGRERAISAAVELLTQGDLVALPTETVYGLAANALSAEAALKIFEAKSRPRFDPLIVHLPAAESLKEVTTCSEQPELVQRLIDTFWPGPLTLVLPRTGRVPDVVTAGLETAAVRMSAHPLFAEVVRRFGKPLAAPSANRFGRISPTSADHVVSELDGLIPLIIDGGPALHGIESTVIAIRGGNIELLRPGPISTSELSRFADVVRPPANARVRSPGQLESHYAPRTPLIVVDDLRTFTPSKNERCALLAWSCPAPAGFIETRQLSQTGDLREAAANLFRLLRQLDESGADLIVAEQVPEGGLGDAIRDRLLRASSRHREQGSSRA